MLNPVGLVGGLLELDGSIDVSGPPVAFVFYVVHTLELTFYV